MKLKRKKYLSIKNKLAQSKIIKDNFNLNKAEIIEEEIIRNKFGFPILIEQKTNKNKPS